MLMEISVLFKPDLPIWAEVQARLAALEKDSVIKKAIIANDLWDELHKSTGEAKKVLRAYA